MHLDISETYDTKTTFLKVIYTYIGNNHIERKKQFAREKYMDIINLKLTCIIPHG